MATSRLAPRPAAATSLFAPSAKYVVLFTFLLVGMVIFVTVMSPISFTTESGGTAAHDDDDDGMHIENAFRGEMKEAAGKLKKSTKDNNKSTNSNKNKIGDVPVPATASVQTSKNLPPQESAQEEEQIEEEDEFRAELKQEVEALNEHKAEKGAGTAPVTPSSPVVSATSSSSATNGGSQLITVGGYESDATVRFGWETPPVDASRRLNQCQVVKKDPFERCGPFLVGLGAMKCGSTSFLLYMMEHPQLKHNKFKRAGEQHYFSFHFKKPIQSYLDTMASFTEENYKGRVNIEKSPSYLITPGTARKMKKSLPDVNLVVLLRDPVDRAYSHFAFWDDKGVNKKDNLRFEQAITKDMNYMTNNCSALRTNNINEGWRWSDITSCYPTPTSFNHFGYVQRGVYVDQLMMWFSVYPREQIYIIKSEDMFANPELELQKATRWLGLTNYDWKLANLKAKNTSSNDKTERDPAMVKMLQDFYRPHNHRLSKLLGRDLTWGY
eukprot:TRINITY_DN5919_c0_g1_i1.p1 TRINITY_DN5919_c0_g1~~TRINITY_DN5919_c0_g1_i1.p1  ORF type:complete len:496 (+),score=124.46 TRINITY_DN5919_c0_g1_i1:318-1805(+)